MGIRKVTDINKAVEGLYSYGRSDGRSPPKAVHEAHKMHSPPTGYERPDPRQQKPQSPEDKPAPGYANDTKKGWLRGRGLHPRFDPGPSGRRFGRRSEEG